MNILLINPPQTNMIKTNVPSFVEEEKGKYPFSIACTISAAEEIENLKNQEKIYIK